MKLFEIVYLRSLDYLVEQINTREESRTAKHRT